jgi:hypothetical protein
MQTRGLKTITIPLRALILSLYVTGGSVLAQTLTLPRTLIAFNSAQGEQLLLQSKARQAYWPLSVQFVTQNNQVYCGVASMVMVLNALSIPAPVAPQYSPYHVFTQENFFNNEQTRKVLTPEVVARQGMTLDQLGQLLTTYPVKAKVYHSTDTSLEEFRKLAVENLQAPNNFILVNYLRKVLGEERGGHISPIAAYNEQTDRFLILDVSRYKYPPIWVKAAALWQAMATRDSVSGKTRGFVLVNRE